MLKELWKKIQRRLLKLRLKPIRVFCFHQVSDTFDESTMHHDDWMPTEIFKQKILDLKQRNYIFISLSEAHDYLRKDIFRVHKYAVLTADDGWASLKNILPWLNEQRIPITLFINPAYLDGKHFRERNTEKYLTQEDLKSLNIQYPLLSIGSHGWEHVDATKQTEQEFSESISNSVNVLRSYPNFIPFFAFTWGYCNSKTYNTVCASNLIPVFMNGNKNFNNKASIYRELLK